MSRQTKSDMPRNMTDSIFGNNLLLHNRIMITPKDTAVFKDDKEMYEFVIIDSKIIKNGFYKTFHNNANKHIEANYKDDLLDGNYRMYNENGILKEIRAYSKGIQGDIVIYCDDNGKRSRVERKIKDVIHTTQYLFDNDNKIHSQHDSNNDKKHGLYINYYPNGLVKEVIYYENDVEIKRFNYV